MIIWIRHGQSTWNVAGRMQYRAEHPPLTDLGRRQVRLTAEALRDQNIDRVWTSPAVRASQSAQIIATTVHAPVSTSDLLTERDTNETSESVISRVEAFLSLIDTRKNQAVVTHGDTLALAVLLLTGNSPGIIDNADWIITPATKPAL